MKISVKFLSLILAIMVAFSLAVPVVAQENNVFLEENFNKIATGGVPSDDFTAKKAGGAEMGVVEIPDARNKSIYMRGTAGGSASLEGTVINPDLVPVTISFRFMVPSGAEASFPDIYDDNGNKKTILTLSDNVLKSGDTVIADIKAKRWYYVAVTFNLSENTYRITLDNNVVENRWSFTGNGINVVAFDARGENSEMYIDDISVTKTTVGGKDRESWPSKMWTTDAQQQVVDDISLSNFTMFNASNVAYKNGERMEMPVPVVEDGDTLFVPLRFVAENIGAEVVWNQQDNAVYMMFGGKTTKLTANSGEVYVDGVKQTLSSNVKTINGTTYIAYNDIADLLGREVNESGGYIMFGPDWDYYQKSETAVKEELYRMVKYQRPTGQDVIDAVIANNPGKSHPRLFARESDFEYLKGLWTTDEFAAGALDYLKASADEYLVAKVTPYVQPAAAGSSSGGRMYSVRRPHEIINTCGLMYHLTGESKYADRVKAELMNMVAFPELGHLSVLDMGDTGECIGVAYDWIYNYEGFTEEDKKTVRDNVRDKLLPPLLGCYRGDNSFYDSLRMTWVYSRYNFNSHINTGALMCLLPMIEDFDKATIDEYVRPILGYLMRSIEFFFDEWYPDGGWHEGPGYGVAVIFQLSYFVSALETAAGTTFGFDTVPGILESGVWSLHMEGPGGGMFNYSDASDGKSIWMQYMFWMAETLDMDIFAAKRRVDLENNKYQDLDPIELLSYNPNRGIAYTPLDELDAYFRGIETVTMRSGWGSNDIYGGLHSGLNGINHAHIDTGSFVLDWNGSRWVKDLGTDDATSHWYNDADDWGTGYRERAEGHNTIVIDNTPYKTYAEGEWPVIFEDDFEDYKVDEDPSKFKISESNSNPNAQGDVGIVNVERAKIDDNLQNQAMRLEMSREKLTGFYAQKSFGKADVAYAEYGLDLSFKFKLENFGNSTGDMTFINFCYIGKGDVPSGTVFGLNLSSSTGELRSPNGSGYVSYGKLDPDKWYDMRFVINIEEQTMNVYIDGEHKGVDLKFPKPINAINYIRLSSAGGVSCDFSALIDDFVIKVDPRDEALALTSARLYDQTLYCNSPVIAYESKERGAYAVTDMTAAYISWVNSAKRGIMLTNNRNAVIIRDELELKSKSDVYWFAHSEKAKVQYTISEDGKSAILENPDNGSKMWAGLLSDIEGATLSVMEADPLPGSPRPDNQADNSMFHKLAVKLEGVEGKVGFSVAFIPLDTGEEKPVDIPADTSFDEWSIPDGELPRLDTVTLDGVQVDSFEPTKTGYFVNVRSDQQIPVVAALYQGEAIEVKQAESLDDYASFKLQHGEETILYRVNFIVEEVTYGYIQGHPITDDSILYSSITSPDYPPKRLIDGDLKTECASYGEGEWFLFDFEEPRDFSKLEIAWNYAEGRNYNFEILYSDDAATWKKAFEGLSTGLPDVYDTYEFDKPIKARYLKFIGYGSNKNLYNNILEIR